MEKKRCLTKFEVSRHGSRSPLFYYASDPYNDPKYWPSGKGTLTNKGKLQMYKLGRYLKQRYDGLFHGKYRQQDIYVRSTRSPRTYMSVAALLAGMFPPVDEQVWNQDLDWQPIPIWSDDSDKNEIVMNHSLCLRFTEQQQQLILESKDYLKLHKDLLDYIKKHSDVSVKTLPDFMSIWDPLSCEDVFGLPLPGWTKSIYPEKMKPIAARMFYIMVCGNKIMNQLISGPLLQDFKSWIERKISGAITEKMLFHSAHDFTILGLLNALGFTNIEPIEPSALLMIELYSSAQRKKNQVKIFYANSSSVEKPVQMILPKCKDPCSLTEFLGIIKEMETEHDWQTECSLK
ncbi:testicular acid phosphatase homolog isoform X2 [Lycorma delicatula]|uniref:testicular acid phosphatase homolog isoform X2 n=1 Tax=Lycorma delicatula TaxID=130591 RepID=UPI003F51758B